MVGVHGHVERVGEGAEHLHAAPTAGALHVLHTAHKLVLSNGNGRILRAEGSHLYVHGVVGNGGFEYLGQFGLVVFG